jgi:hypothetical protein
MQEGDAYHYCLRDRKIAADCSHDTGWCQLLSLAVWKCHAREPRPFLITQSDHDREQVLLREQDLVAHQALCR